MPTLVGHNRQLDIKCVHETVWRLSNLVKLVSFRVSSRENVKIWMTDLQHWDEHPHSTLCMWKVPVCWHGCCLGARPGSRCGAIKKNQKQRSWLVRTWTEPCCLHFQDIGPKVTPNTRSCNKSFKSERSCQMKNCVWPLGLASAGPWIWHGAVPECLSNGCMTILRTVSRSNTLGDLWTTSLGIKLLQLSSI